MAFIKAPDLSQQQIEEGALVAGGYLCSMLDFPLGMKPQAARKCDSAGASSARAHLNKVAENCCLPLSERNPAKARRFLVIKMQHAFKLALRAKAGA